MLPARKKRGESRALGTVVFFEDLLFCIFAGICLILLFYQANNGKFRFPALLSAGAGFLLYRQTLGRCVMLFSEVIAFAIGTAVRYAVFFLLLPFRTAAAWSCSRVRRAVNDTTEIRRRSVRRRFTEDEAKRATVNACGLIPENAPQLRTIKRGKQIAKGKKAVQSNALDANTAGGVRGRVHRGIRQ